MRTEGHLYFKLINTNMQMHTNLCLTQVIILLILIVINYYLTITKINIFFLNRCKMLLKMVNANI